MQSRKVIRGDEMRQKLKKGADLVADTTKITLGPKGRTVILAREFMSPKITKDGVSVNKELFLEDPVEQLGAQIIREASMRSNDLSGDGTTTVCVLAQSILAEGMKLISAGASPIQLKEELDNAAKLVINKLKDTVVAVNDANLEDIASISANNKEIGLLVATVYKEIGLDGIVTVEEGSQFGLTTEIVSGLRFDKGYISPYFITDREKLLAEYKDVPVLVTDEKLTTSKLLFNIIDKVIRSGKKELIIIADDVADECLGTLILNTVNGAFKSVCIKAPGFGDTLRDNLDDIASLCGATVISLKESKDLEKMELTELGHASRVIVTKDNTTIVGGKKDEVRLTERILSLKMLLDKAVVDIERQSLNKRIANLSGGIGVIKVRYATETETMEVKDRIEDAIQATKAALEEGVVVGGGISLLRARQVLEIRPDGGSKILFKACAEPLKQIAFNADVDGNVVASVVLTNSNVNHGFNALSGVYEDLFKSGVIDPLKVVRLTLENAVSAAGTLLTVEAAVYDTPEVKKENN